MISKYFLLSCFFIYSILANAYEVQLTWDIPTKREDDSVLPLAEIQGYNLYYGPDSLNLTAKQVLKNTDKAFTVTNIPFGTQYYFQISTTDSDGLEGKRSPTVTIDKPPTPSNFRIIITLRNYIIDQFSLANLQPREQENIFNEQLAYLLRQLKESSTSAAAMENDFEILTTLIEEDLGLTPNPGITKHIIIESIEEYMNPLIIVLN